MNFVAGTDLITNYNFISSHDIVEVNLLCNQDCTRDSIVLVVILAVVLPIILGAVVICLIVRYYKSKIEENEQSNS